MSDAPPEVVRKLLDERGAARERRDWASADALRDEIRSLGWEPIDSAAGSRLRPALPDGPGTEVGYARPEDLDPLLDEPATLDASVVVQVDDHAEDLARLADGLRAHAPGVTWELVTVANGVAEGLDANVLAALPASVLPTTARLGWADATNLGLRRVRGRIAVLLDTSVEPVGAFVEPLLEAFADERVGVAGPWGVTSADGRQFVDAAPGEVDAVQAYCLAIRREALQQVRGFDRRFRFYRNADLDLSFAVRAAGWRAIATEPLPLVRHAHRGWAALPDEERDRLSKRNFYRFLDHWGGRPDLLLANRADTR
jgi:GT2 family glycosyltransferase